MKITIENFYLDKHEAELIVNAITNNKIRRDKILSKWDYVNFYPFFEHVPDEELKKCMGLTSTEINCLRNIQLLLKRVEDYVENKGAPLTNEEFWEMETLLRLD